MQVVLRIWDCVLIEGPKVTLRVAMALLKVGSVRVHAIPGLNYMP